MSRIHQVYIEMQVCLTKSRYMLPDNNVVSNEQRRFPDKSVFSFLRRCKHDTARSHPPCCYGYESKTGRACCRRAVQQSIDIAYLRGPQQQTRRKLLQRVNGTQRRTPYRYTDSAVYYMPAVSTSFCSASWTRLSTWHCPHLLLSAVLRRPAPTAVWLSINISCRAAFSSKLAVRCRWCGRTMGQTDGQTDGRLTQSSTYYAGSANRTLNCHRKPRDAPRQCK